jgi:hypothetical protein
LPEQRNVLALGSWKVRALRRFVWAGVQRQPGEVIDPPEANDARQMIEAGNAVYLADWPIQQTNMPWALQNVVPGSGGAPGVGSINGMDGDLQILAGANITVTNNPPAGTITISAAWPNASQVPLSPAVGSWLNVQQAITALSASAAGFWQAGTGGAIYYTGGRVGIGVTAPAYSLDVAGSVNVAGGFFVNGVLFAGSPTPLIGGVAGSTAYVAAAAPPSPVEGQFWYDSSRLKLFLWYSDEWREI